MNNCLQMLCCALYAVISLLRNKNVILFSHTVANLTSVNWHSPFRSNFCKCCIVYLDYIIMMTNLHVVNYSEDDVAWDFPLLAKGEVYYDATIYMIRNNQSVDNLQGICEVEQEILGKKSQLFGSVMYDNYA